MKELLTKLLNEPTPSSYEKLGMCVWDSFMEELGLTREYVDKIGNSGWSLGTGKTTILLSAHIDEIGMAVQGISDDGYITVVSLGGVDSKVLPGAQVIIFNEQTSRKGVVCKEPIHSEYYEDRKDKIQKIKELKISVGADSKEEVESMGIEIGSLVVLERNVNVSFGTNKICGNALDDKLGVYTVAMIAKLLKTLPIPDDYKIIFLAGVQEETGLRGLTVAASNINPDISIDLDVTPAQDGDCGVDKNIWGDIRLGKGCVIEYGPDKSRRIGGIMKDYAKRQDIPFQLSVSRDGGTNTSAIQLSSKNCETMLVSLPNINMHTQNEICDWRDVDSAISIISGIISRNLL